MKQKRGNFHIFFFGRAWTMAQPAPTKTWSSSPLVERMILDFTGCSTLQDVLNLDLSKRKISTLDPAVFSKMVGLEVLNLSNNRISGFPINLGLRKLRILNLHHNHLKSVATLEQFPDLEELNIENNLLSVSSQYRVQVWAYNVFQYLWRRIVLLMRSILISTKF